MKERIDNEKYDVRMWPSDWRYSAAIVGMIRFFDKMGIDYEQKDDYIDYCFSDVCGEVFESKYLSFVEWYFDDKMHHIQIEKMLEKDNLTESQIKFVNKKLEANTICKKVFEKRKYSEETKDDILQLIEENRLQLIKETYRNTIYRKYANENKLFDTEGMVCRLHGFYVDLPKKSKSMAFNWDYKTYVANDIPEFDFIPFAFSKTDTGYFINNNCSIKHLYKTNADFQDILYRKAEEIKENEKERKAKLNEDNSDNDLKDYSWKVRANAQLFLAVEKSGSFIDYDVEVIRKSVEKEHYETLYVKRTATKILEDINKKNKNQILENACRMDNKEYMYPQNEVVESVLNNIHLDGLIERFLKERENMSWKAVVIDVLIEINQMIYGGQNMEVVAYKAKLDAEKIVDKLDANKVNSYKQKLTSAICFKDYDRFCQILLQLSSFAGVPFEFAYDLFDDFEAHKNVAYAFVNALNKKNDKEETVEKKGGKKDE